jgi:hypothetical protein
MSFGGGGTQTTVQSNEPYAPAQPALNQIVSEAQNIYGAGPQYVAPTAQTLEGLAAQETIARQANQQISDTIAGRFNNPFLSPIIAQAAEDVYTNVATQFSGAGRTPTSPLAQQQVTSQVAQRALPFAFQQLEREIPSLFNVGQTLEGLELQRQAAPYDELVRFSNIINPVARGGSTFTTQAPRPNRIGQAAGGAIAGATVGNQIFGPTGGAVGGVLGALGGLL